MRGHRSFVGGTGCFRRGRGEGVLLPSPSSPIFHTRDRQAELVPQVIRERHRAKLARNGEDCW